jgi:hypothetical protein
MKIFRMLAVLLGVASFLASSGPVTRADEWDKATKVTFSEPVQVPGKVLPAGTYVFRLLDDPANRHVVQIFNEDHTSLITTIMAINNERLKASGKTVLLYDERPADQPVALAAWFYPGDGFGQEFVYPKSQAEELSRLNKREVPSSGSNEGYTKSEEAVTPQPKADTIQEPAPTPEPSTAQAQPEPTPAPTPAPAVNPNPAPHSTEAAPQSNPMQAARPLPQTASLLPLLGLVSFTLLGAALVLRLALRS